MLQQRIDAGAGRVSFTQALRDGAPSWVVLLALVIAAYLLGRVSTQLEAVQVTEQGTQRELRLLGLHMDEFNAILVREGIARPRDLIDGPTAAPVRPAAPAAAASEGKR